MKILSLFLVILFSFNLWSQVRTGGVGVHEPGKDIAEFLPPDEGGSTKPTEISKKIKDYTKHLQRRENFCRSQGMRYLEIDQDIMQVYMKLSLLRHGFVADKKCSTSNAYFKCLSDKEAQKKIGDIIKDKRTLKFMHTQYRASEKEAKEILEFFREMDKGCPGDNCVPAMQSL